MSVRKLALFAATFFFIITFANFTPVITSPAYATNGYIDPNTDGTIGIDWPTTGSSFYTEIDEAIRQPNAPTTTDYIYHLNNKTDTAFLRMSTISGVGSVSQIVVWIYHNDGSNGQFHVQLYDDNESTTRSSEASFTSSSSNAWHSVTFSGLSLTQAQLDSLSMRLRNSKVGGGGPTTNYIYAMYADVTYSNEVSISLTTDGSISFGNLAANTTQDTTSSGINDVETVRVDSGPADLDVRSTNFTEGANTWSLGSSNGSNQVKWEFSPNGSSWTTFAIVDTLYTLATNVSQGSTQNMYLRLTTPTATSSYSQFTTTITIVASAP